MTLIKQEFYTKDRILSELTEIVEQLNEFVNKIEPKRLNDYTYKIGINESNQGKPKFEGTVTQTKISTTNHRLY